MTEEKPPSMTTTTSTTESHEETSDGTTTTTSTTESHHEAKRAARWMRDATVPVWTVIAGAVLIVGLFSFIVWRVEDTRRETAAADRVQEIATCENANEFRGFLGNFLESQGTGSEFSFAEVPGFDDLDSAVRAYLLHLDDFVLQNREAARKAAVDYRREFPVVKCPAR